MSDNKTEYSYYIKVKNESARKRLGFPFAFWWKTDNSETAALARLTVSMLDAGFEPTDFAKPVRVNFPVVNELPPEGSFDTTLCQKYELGGEDGKTFMLIPGAPATDAHDEKTEECADNAGTEESGTQDTDNQPSKHQLTVVATLPFRHRVLAQYIGDGEYLYHVDTDQKKEIACLEMDTQNTTVQNLILAAENVEPFKKAIEHDIHKVVNAYKQVFPVDGKVPELCTTIQFFKEWFSAEHINRGLLVKEWAERLRNKPAPAIKPEPPEVNVSDVNRPERPRRSEKPTHRMINYELACGFCENLDLNNLRPAMEFAKRIIAEDREDWKRMSMTVGIIPDIKGYDRQTIIDLVRKAPKAVHNGNPELRRVWCESFLAVHGVRDPDWYEYVPDNAPTTHEENTARLRKAGKCLRDIEAGRFQCDEEKPQSSGAMADEPATPETMEPDTTEHHQDAQPLNAQSQIDAAYQKKLAELHEARNNIPPKNPVDFGKQLAAARGEYVEGISDPNDPKWVHNDYSASNQDETADDKGQEKACNTCGKTGRGNCPDCGTVMGDATYKETFGVEKSDDCQEKDQDIPEKDDSPQQTNNEDAQHGNSANETDHTSNTIDKVNGHHEKESTSQTWTHLMVDLETMGTNPDAPIVAIAAILFDPQTGEIGGAIFYVVISLVDAMESGAVPDGGTIEWWLQQSGEARSALLVDQRSLVDALLQLREFINEHSDEKLIQVWGNGATFDNVILRRSYERLGIPCPWRFYNNRDIRTIVELGKAIGYDARNDIAFEGERHNALDDARHQAKYVSAIWQKLIPNQADF
ncbi:exonuclease [Salmonella enterica]|nr:exonuclease [Salmonella enterica]